MKKRNRVWAVLASCALISALSGCEALNGNEQNTNTPLYTITIPTFSGGSITANPQSAQAETVITLTISPGQGKRLTEGSLTVTSGTTVVPLSPVPGNESQYTFTMPAENVTVAATFENANVSGYLQLQTRGIKSLYISDLSVQSAGSLSQSMSRAATDTGTVIHTLSYINAQQENAPVYFTSPSNKTVILNANSLRQIDDTRIIVDFNSWYGIRTVDTDMDGIMTAAYIIDDQPMYQSGRALIDMETGTAYDFAGYDMQVIHKGYVYATRQGALYKINLDNMSAAIPLNNAAYNSIGSINPPIIINNKALTNLNGYSFDINSQFTPQTVKDAVITPDMCPSSGASGAAFFNYNLNIPIPTPSILIQDLEGIPWYFRHIATWPSGNISEPVYWYFVGKVSIDDQGQLLLSDCSEGLLSLGASYYDFDGASIFVLNATNTGRIGERGSREQYNANGLILVDTNGFISLKKKASGIQVDSAPLSFPALDRKKCLVNKDNYLYYLEGTAIKRLYLASGSSPETVYSNSRILASAAGQDLLTASGNNLVFYQYAEDNITVNTYSLPMYEPGAQPRLLASVSADVRDIVELDF
jgi:hypothetical protein